MLHALLAPYKPNSDAPFDAVRAGHLLNRAGFGGTPAEVEKVMKMGPADAVDWLMDFPATSAADEDPKDVPQMATIDGAPATTAAQKKLMAGKTEEERKAIRAKFMQANHQALMSTLQWWLKRMANGPYPLQEKLTLFWHGHFTTSAKDERSASLMWRQNELLRKNATGNFETFVRAISRDPAMLDYLNNNENRKQHANENYARELMELFTLGIGNYTETDIKQSARAFTGWGHDGDDFVFRKNQHDYGTKTFFGQSGDFNGDDILTLILRKPACAQFISGELFKYFAYEQYDAALGNALAQTFLDNHYELRPLIRTILTSNAFYSDQAIGVQIKSPVQLVIGTIRMLNLDMPRQGTLESTLNQMGQMPMMPPNVRGWPGGRMWINTSTLFIRYNTGVWLAGGEVPALYRVGRKAGGKALHFRGKAGETDFDPEVHGSAAEVADVWISRLIHRPVTADRRKVFIDALGNNPNTIDSQKRLVQLIVSTPEYQLC